MGAVLLRCGEPAQRSSTARAGQGRSGAVDNGAAAPSPAAMTDVTIEPLGDAAFTLYLAAPPGPQTTARLTALAARLARAPGVVDVAPSFSTVTVHLDPLTADRAALEAEAARSASEGAEGAAGGDSWLIPVCFDAEFGPDQQEVADETGLSAARAVQLLIDAPLTVLAVGFLPGFPFCGMAPDPLRLKRKATPRTRVPQGSVAVANGFAGIYPWVSPGGWRILGRTPLRLFDPERARPALFAPGDAIRFRPIDRAEFDALAARTVDPSEIAA
jgi:KipI family sensor histidine kinase inhibitor